MVDPITAVATTMGLVGFVVGLLPGFIIGAAYAQRHKRTDGVKESDRG